MTEKKKSSPVSRIRQWLLASIRKTDGPLIEASDVLYFGGMALAGYGVYQVDSRLGLIVTGALLLLTVRPLWHWIK